MRTTLTIDDRIARHLKEIEHRSGKPFRVVVNEILQLGLAVKRAPIKLKRRLRPASLGKVLPGIDFHKALALAGALEDQEIARKLGLRK